MSSPLDPVLATADTEAFYDALGELWTDAFYEQRDTAPRRLRMLFYASDLDFQLKLGLHNLFLDDDTALSAPELASWCREIGAARTAELLETMIALFPRREIIRGTRKRENFVYDNEARFAALEKPYEDVPAELARKLRAWLETHQADVEAEYLAAVPPQPPKPPKPEKSPATRIAAVLKLRKPMDFLMEARLLAAKYDGMDFHARPAPLGMLGGLDALHADLTNGGIKQFLTQREGSGFKETLAWCRAIGAKQMVKYLEGAQALFPRGRVPVEDDRRFAFVMKLEEKTKSPVEPLDPFDKLDEKYRGARDEIAVGLRAWITEHRDELAAAMAAPAQRDGSPADVGELMKRDGMKALTWMKSKVQELKDDIAARHLLAEQRGLRTLDGSEDPRVVAFMDSLAGITTDQWKTICRRHVSSPRKINSALGETTGVMADLMVRLMGHERFTKLVSDPAMRVRERTIPVMSRIPEETKIDRKAFPLKRVAVAAANGAWQALVYYDWLMVTQPGARAVKNLLSPFNGFARLPDDLPR